MDKLILYFLAGLGLLIRCAIFTLHVFVSGSETVNCLLSFYSLSRSLYRSLWDL